jgi:cbb3-type cytochrome oxidase subunit 1
MESLSRIYGLFTLIPRTFTSRSWGPRKLTGMADFIAVLGVAVFVAAMLGLIWGLDHV